jgi:hypothetical protein
MKAKTFKELYYEIKSSLESMESFEGHVRVTPGALDWIQERLPPQKQNEAILAFIRIKSVVLDENPQLKLPDITDKCLSFDLMDKCLKAQSIVDAATTTVPVESPVQKPVWSEVLTKLAIAKKLRLYNTYKLNRLVETGIYEIKKAGNRQQWQIRIDTLPPEIQKKFSQF